ncbi:hypothetical protein SteCoe_15534 [Stentor coeruleus]|uniref:C3HC-type domain-containing protein n=1 Tax=Stentor coeruleus TaxID=5963 RepID=A0A1R2C3A6_9CILI|nr:hypothetical protein SteCoe_15534 [Stentor coeruleus]
MDDFIKRLKTFKLITWMGKSKELSPVECAKRGYINTSKDTITCTHCGAFFNSCIYYESNILSMHSEYCKLSIPISLTYDDFSAFTIPAFVARENSYNSLEVLPCIKFHVEHFDLDLFSKVFPAFPKINLRVIYTLFGWTAGYERVYCDLCGIVIECSRREYSLVKARNLYNVYGGKKKHKLSLRNVEIPEGKLVDLSNFHRYYCPWINDITVNHFEYFTNKCISENVGWKIVFNKLIANSN